MSQENVELVRGLQPAPDVDIAELLRDDDIWAALSQAVAPFAHADFECALRSIDSEPTTYTGLDGLRTGWLDWVAPWATYRTEIKEVIDAGERVLVLTHDFGRREGSTEEVRLIGAAVWTIRDRKIVRAEFYTDRAEAFAAVGLADQAMSQQNVEIVQRWVDALNAADVASFLDVWDHECEFFSVTGSQLDGTPYRGHEGLRRFWKERMETWTELRFEVERILEGINGDVVVAVGLLRGRGQASGVLIDQRLGVVFELRDRKIRFCRSYSDPEDALEAAGLET
jgi:ketosteroid isomerase-like protein